MPLRAIVDALGSATRGAPAALFHDTTWRRCQRVTLTVTSWSTK